MRFHLTFVKGPEKGRTVALAAGQRLIVGRGHHCGLQILDPHVSRNHLRLEVTTTGVLLVDAGGRYGTRVNGETVQSHQLEASDLIEIGETQIRFDDQSGSATDTLKPKSAKGTLPPKP